MVLFYFLSLKDLVKILSDIWLCHGGSLMLKNWRVSFDPAKDYFQMLHVWVLLPGLLVQFWNHGALVAIGNEIG